MRVTFWAEDDAACVIVEHDGEKVCVVMRCPPDGEGPLSVAANRADLLIVPGDLAQGLALKQRAGAKLLALCAPGALATNAVQKSTNVFVPLQKMSFDL